MSFDIAILQDYWPLFLQGAWLTVRITLVAFLIAYAAGILVALAALAPSRLLRSAAGVYVGVLRAIPFIIILFLVHYGLPFAGVRLPAYITGTLALALFASAYYAEIVRGAIANLPRGQFESARVIGMSPAEAMRHVVFPQIARGLVPPSVNMTLTMIKESSVLSSITVAELTYQSLVVQGNTFAPFEAFAAVTLIYWAITLLVSRGAALLEGRLGVAERQDVERSALAASFLSLETPRRR